MQKVLRIDSIFEGQAPSQYFGVQGTYLSSIAIDPDYPISSSSVKTSGFAVPIGYAKFSGSNVNSHTVALITNPKDTKTYAVLRNGKLISYDNALSNETLVGTVAGSQASGGFYYNNYIYILGTGSSHDDVSRYGPLNNSPTLVDNVWKGATLGSLTALTDTTYPSLRSIPIPNHVGYVHGDNAAYFTDFKNGQGLIHKISTRKVTDEGDTNGNTVPSAYNVLDLPFGFYPTGITTVSTYLMIIGIYSTDATVEQGKAAFVLWDPTNTTTFFQGPTPLPDALATACLSRGGDVFIWTGNAQNGVRLSQYMGGESVKDLVFQEEGLPPIFCGVDAVGNRLVWGGFTTQPTDVGSVWGHGSKDARLPDGLHHVAKTSGSGTTPFVTAVKYVQQDSYKQPKVIAAWNDGSTQGIDKYSASATLGSNMRWMFNLGQRFQIQKIRIPFAGAVDANTTITPTVYIDDFSSNPTALPVINNTNNSNKRKVIFRGSQLSSYVGENNFVFELAWTGTNPLTVALPILITVDIKEDEPE